MKIIFVIFSSLFCLCSCKKIYTCECNTTFTQRLKSGNFITEVIPGSKTPYTEKLTSSQAEAACEHEEVATQTNFTNTMTNNGSFPLYPGESISTSCLVH
ncbi:hypothetical protein [Aurantibacillus circumpalustris]|uniref:hypothetical protein n=1 Tax=Aurantibacillus circumpalustris TaxID=3036359 RepID=UPI00295A8763|nr:hypothetical protein [Aurantibacillus circumpalustris]